MSRDDNSDIELGKLPHEVEVWFKNYVDNSSDAMIVLSTTREIVYQNPQAKTLCQKVAAETLRDALQASLQIGTLQPLQLEVENDRVFVELAATQISWQDEPALLVTLRDITQRELLIQESKGRNRILEMIGNRESLFDILTALTKFLERQIPHISFATTLYDPEEQIISHVVSPTVPEEVTAMLAEMNGEPDAERWQQYAELLDIHQIKAAWSNPLISNVNGELLGSLEMFSVDEGPLTPGVNRFIRMATHLSSIAIEHARAEDTLTHAKDAAIAAAKTKAAFLANMSHEIRTPLTSILGYGESLLDVPNFDEERRTAVSSIVRNADHLLQVINDILDLSKIEAGKLTVERSDVEIFPLIDEVSSLAQLQANERQLEFTVNHHFPLPKNVHTDPVKLKQILINLIGNALKFTPEGSVKVQVWSNSEKNLLFFSVEDTGIGMTKEQLDVLFRAFTQADSSITRRFGGTGLGLNISHELVQLLGGEISVRSAPEEGSVFTFSIDIGSPLELEQVTVCPKSNPDNEPEKLAQANEVPKLKGSVLLVEDGEDNRALISYLVKKTGLSITTAENGQLGVDAALNDDFDLILMDMQMPVKDGYAATREIRKAGLSVPIVALTASTLSSDCKKCFDAGCDEFMAKPFKQMNFFALLGRYTNAPEETQVTEMPDGFEEMVAQYKERLPQRISEVLVCIDEGDLESLAKVAHKIAGSAGLYGFNDLSVVAKELELNAKDNSVDLVTESWTRLQSIADQVLAK